MKRTTDELSLSIPIKFNLQGAKLETLSQATAYRGIGTYQATPPRNATLRNLELTREALSPYLDTLETDETIWRSMRKCTIRLRVQQFLFKLMHSTQMIGEVWFNIRNHEQRGTCSICNTTESMSHIITSCRATPVNLIWDLAKYLWLHDPTKWPQINLGLILGVGCLVIKTPNTEQERDARNNTTNNRDAQQRDKNNKGASRLLQILILKAAHLIWLLRCERVIHEKHHDPHEIRAQWFGVINRRLTEDMLRHGRDACST